MRGSIPAAARIAGWTVDPAILAPLALGLVLYMAGTVRLWRSAGPSRGASYWQVASFVAGWLCAAAALASPLHALSRELFTAHMIEHELVMAIAAPLLVLSRPLPVLLWAFPASWRPNVARAGKTFAYLIGWEFLSRPLVATALHAAAIWIWHVPALFDAALENEVLHWLQHLSFFVTAMFFWWALFSTRRRLGVAIACLFVTGLHTSVLGVLLAMARQPLYPTQARLAARLGTDPLLDQQLAGIIMWVPAGFIYAAAGLTLAGLLITRWSEAEQEQVRSA